VRFGLIALGIGTLAVTGLIGWFGASAIGREVLQAAWVIPPIIALHAGQLWLSAIAWRAAIGEARPKTGRYLRIRWIREAVNSMLPVAQLGGNLVGIRLLMQRGISGPVASAGTIIDVTVEAITQFLFTAAGIAVLALIGVDRAWAPWVEGGMIAMGIGLAGFVVAQRVGALRLVEWLAERLSRLFPTISVDVVRGLHGELLRLQSDRGALLQATGLHLVAWVLGVGETWLALYAMGVPVSWADALVIESMGMAARSAGFVVPGALGVQEAGFILVGGLFGIPPDATIALSMIKRVRELVVGLSGMLAWQVSEGKRLLRR
jgi:putative membrane protein